MDAELLMFDRILNCSTDSSLIADLKISEPDKFRWILLNLERYGDCKRYCQLHSVGETYADVKQAILDFRQRTVLNSQDFRTVNQPLSAFGGDPPSRHSSQEKYPHVECWKCGKKGHYARHCRSDANSPARSLSNGSGRSKGHRKGGNSGSPEHRKGAGKEERKSEKGKGKNGEKGKSKKGKGKAGVRAAEYQEEQLEPEELEPEAYEVEGSEEVWSEAGDLTELRLSMFVRSQSNREDAFVRSESNREEAVFGRSQSSLEEAVLFDRSRIE